MTHAFFAEDLYKRLDNKRYVELEDLKTFSQGHDIFFFSTNLHNKQKKIGNYMHKNNTKNFFINMITYIHDNKLQNDKNIISFLYGNICHYALDSSIHPYVTYKTGVFNKKKKETYKYNSKHNDLESYVDAYMISQREKIKPNKFKLHKFCFNAKVSNNLSKLVDYVYNKTYGFNKMALYLKQGIFNMKVSYRFLRYDPIKIKKKIYNIVDKISPNTIKKLSPISLAYELNNNDYYLNLSRKTWLHPRYKNEKYNSSIKDIYNNALNMALGIIKEVNKILYENGDINKLNTIFTNISFTSGKDCNDKTKNKYFEF